MIKFITKLTCIFRSISIKLLDNNDLHDNHKTYYDKSLPAFIIKKKITL